jgi:hypothetical protein
MHRIELQRIKWEKTYADTNIFKTEINKKSSFVPLQLPVPPFSTQEEVDKHINLLNLSDAEINMDKIQQNINKWCVPFCLVSIVLTCGCGGLCCLGCFAIALKNKIIRGSWTLG